MPSETFQYENTPLSQLSEISFHFLFKYVVVNLVPFFKIHLFERAREREMDPPSVGSLPKC